MIDKIRQFIQIPSGHQLTLKHGVYFQYWFLGGLYAGLTSLIPGVGNGALQLGRQFNVVPTSFSSTVGLLCWSLTLLCVFLCVLASYWFYRWAVTKLLTIQPNKNVVTNISHLDFFKYWLILHLVVPILLVVLSIIVVVPISIVVAIVGVAAGVLASSLTNSSSLISPLALIAGLFIATLAIVSALIVYYFAFRWSVNKLYALQMQQPVLPAMQKSLNHDFRIVLIGLVVMSVIAVTVSVTVNSAHHHSFSDLSSGLNKIRLLLVASHRRNSLAEGELLISHGQYDAGLKKIDEGLKSLEASSSGGQSGNPNTNGNSNERANAAGQSNINFGPYMADLQRRIKRAWSSPKGEESKRVVVLFKVHKQGKLSNLRVQTSSGVTIADQAALTAVQNAAPFPPLPPGAPDSVDVQFTFDYNVLKSISEHGPQIYRAFFYRGFAQYMLGRYEDAIGSYKKCCELVDRHHTYAIYSPIYCYFCYKELGDDKSANSILQDCVRRSEHTLWPYPAVEYLLGQETAEKFESEATDNGKMTEAKTYIGMNLLLQGQQQQGLDCLKWVEAHGDKGYFEYRLATAKHADAVNEHQ